MQAHNQTGAIQLCHTSCVSQTCRLLQVCIDGLQFLFNGGTLSDYLTKVKTWMDSNPNDGTLHLLYLRDITDSH
jgi:hypothetical protein